LGRQAFMAVQQCVCVLHTAYTPRIRNGERGGMWKCIFMAAAIAFKHRTMQLLRMNSSQLDQSCWRTPHTHGTGSHTLATHTHRLLLALSTHFCRWADFGTTPPGDALCNGTQHMCQIPPDLLDMLLTNC